MRDKLSNLEVDFAGVWFKNPFLLSASPPAMDADHIIRAAEKGWGGAVTKTIGVEVDIDLKPRLGSIRSGKRPIAMENIELISTKSIDTWCNEYIPEIKDKAPSDFVLIASIIAGKESDEWGELARRVQEAGADMIELNVSCPHGMPQRGMGMFIGQNAEMVANVTKGAKKNTNLPVIVKLTPNVTDIGHIAIKAENAGANALSAINTVSAIIGVDIVSEIPIPNVKGYSAPGGLSGPAVRPVALRCIHEICKASSLPISGIGGVEDWRSSVEFILMGASTIQLCTQVMWKGYDIIEKLKSGLTSYMDKKGYNNIADFCGNASKRIVQYPMLELQPGLHAEIDTEKCKGCGLCVTACRDGAFNALTMENKKARVYPERCDCCGLCQIVCRFDAVRFVGD